MKCSLKHMIITMAIGACASVNAQLPELPGGACIPNCPTLHLYSIGDLHFYSTESCGCEPIAVGFGTSAEVITEFGCVEGVCENPITTIVLQNQIQKLETQFAKEPEAAIQQIVKLLKSLRRSERSGKFSFAPSNPRSLGQQKALVKKRLEPISNNADDPRQGVAYDIITGETSKLDQWVAGLESDNAPTRAAAADTLSRLADFLESAAVESGDETLIRTSDGDKLIGYLDDPADLSDVIDIENDDWTVVDAKCYRKNESGPFRYVTVKEKSVRYVFRLQEAYDNDGHRHLTGQQVAFKESGQDSVDIKGQNGEVVFSQDHVHVIRVRARLHDEDEDDMIEFCNFLVYSADELDLLP